MNVGPGVVGPEQARRRASRMDRGLAPVARPQTDHVGAGLLRDLGTRGGRGRGAPVRRPNWTRSRRPGR